jgi:hypothetical protein
MSINGNSSILLSVTTIKSIGLTIVLTFIHRPISENGKIIGTEYTNGNVMVTEKLYIS